MRAEHLLREAAVKTGSQLYMIYALEETDPPGLCSRNWLFEGLSHDVTHVFQVTYADVLRPFKTKCGIHVTTHIEKKTANLYNLVAVDTTCIWCISGKAKDE